MARQANMENWVDFQNLEGKTLIQKVSFENHGGKYIVVFISH
jgi:hypothetical protein